MLGDDYGYANVGFPHGPNPGNPEARTPTMDALVKEGVLLERHCTPPRPHTAALGALDALALPCDYKPRGAW